MDDARLGRSVLVLRQRRGWRQVDLAARSGVSQSAISDIERGRAERYTLSTLRAVLRALDASADLDVRWGGRGDLDRLLDHDHARLLETWIALHAEAGWLTWSEASYSIYGERGRIDLLAFHPETRILEVVEAKTGIWDTQETIGRLDVKVRLARQVAAQREWAPSRIVGCLLLAENRTTRRRIAEHDRLFAGFDLRGRAARAFVKAPHAAATGLLVFIPLPHEGRRAGQHRVRARRTSGTPCAERST